MQHGSHSHIDFILNGHRFGGWAEDNPPYDFEYESATETQHGQDGGVFVLGIPMFGLIATFKFLASSPSTQWCIQQEQIRKNSHREKTAQRVYAGSFGDPVRNVSLTLSGGFLPDQLPAFPVAGAVYEAKFQFELAESLVDGGVFHPPLTSDATAAPAAASPPIPGI